MRDGRRSVPVDLDGVEVHVVAVQTGTEREVAFTDLEMGKVFDGIKVMATRVADVLDNVRPDKASVEIDIGVEVGKDGIVARFFGTAADCGFKMTLEWERPRPAGGETEEP